MSKVDAVAFEYAKENGTLGLDYNQIYDAVKYGFHQAEKDLTDKARLSSGWDGFYYGQGYKQAEKDLELTWEDIKVIFLLVQVEWTPKKTDKEIYQEVLKRFQDYKERNK